MDHEGNSEIQLVAVVPEARGGGITSKLLGHALADAAERGSETSTLIATRPAIRSTSAPASSRWSASRCGNAAPPPPSAGLAHVEALGIVHAVSRSISSPACHRRTRRPCACRARGRSRPPPHDSWFVWLVQVANELAVDLEDVEGRVLEVVERGESRAEVVEAKLAAQPATGCEALGPVHVHDRRGLRDLHAQPASVGAGVLELARSATRSGSVTDLAETFTSSGCHGPPLLLASMRVAGAPPSGRSSRSGRCAPRRGGTCPGRISLPSSPTIRTSSSWRGRGRRPAT